MNVKSTLRVTSHIAFSDTNINTCHKNKHIKQALVMRELKQNDFDTWVGLAKSKMDW